MGILQARILEWVAMSSSRGFFPHSIAHKQPREQEQATEVTLQRQSQESRGWLRVLQSGELGVQGHSTLRPVLGLSVTCLEAPVSQKKSHPAGCSGELTPTQAAQDDSTASEALGADPEGVSDPLSTPGPLHEGDNWCPQKQLAQGRTEHC